MASFVGQIILRTEFHPVCDKCKKSFDFTLNDCYIWLPNGRVRIDCPHCGQAHDLSIKVQKTKKERKHDKN